MPSAHALAMPGAAHQIAMELARRVLARNKTEIPSSTVIIPERPGLEHDSGCVRTRWGKGPGLLVAACLQIATGLCARDYLRFELALVFCKKYLIQ